MGITRFKNWRIQYKIMSISVISVAVMMMGLFTYLLPLIEGRIIKEKRDATRHIVELAMGIIEVQDAEKRPVAAVADHDEVRSVRSVDISMDHSISLNMLFDPGHNLDERILREQFGF